MPEDTYDQRKQMLDLEHMTVEEIADFLSRVVLLLRRMPPDLVPGVSVLEESTNEKENSHG